MPVSWAGMMGAGDGNRTRTVSLANQQIGASDRPDLDIRCTASDRQGPCDTRVNGPPMARGSMTLSGPIERLALRNCLLPVVQVAGTVAMAVILCPGRMVSIPV